LSLAPGAKLGPYEILAPLGAGGMGEVYRACDARLGRDVAIKILPEGFATDSDRLARFEREGRAVAALSHPNILAIYDFGREGVTAYAVMELLEGDTLRDRLAQGPLPPREAISCAVQIAHGLAAAHDKGIAHRDLKPENLFVAADGRVKILDFGLAKLVDPGGPGGPGGDQMTGGAGTSAGSVMGTVGYMAPEQVRGQTVDHRADIFALGAVLHEMLSGRGPFHSDSAADMMTATLAADPPDLDQTGATVPPALARIVRRCLEKRPEARFQSAHDLAFALEASGSTVSGSTPAAEQRSAAWRRALPWGLAASLAVALIALSAVASLNQDSDTGPIIRLRVEPPFGVTRPVQGGFAISPDGQALAFSATAADGRSRIFLRRVDHVEAQPIAGTENGVLPFWSPDSQSLGFTKEGALYRTDLGGTDPRRLCEIPGRVEATNFARSAATWGGRGVIVFASPEGRLFQVPDGGGTPTPVTSLDPAHNEAWHRSPSFLPDGRRVLFLALGAGATRGVIWAVAVDNPARTRVTESSGGAAYAAGQLLTTTELPRRLVAQSFDPDRLTLSGAPRQVQNQIESASTRGDPGFSVSLNDLVVEPSSPQVHQLVWMDRVGRVLKTIGPVARIFDFALAPDERRVVANITDISARKNDLWLFDDQRTEGTRLTFQPDTRRPLWARDGNHVYFTTMPGFQTWSLRLSAAAQPEPFENPGKFSHFEDVTRTSAYVLFRSREPATIWMQRIGDPSERRELVRVGVHHTSGPRVSPDGRWLAYALTLPAGPEVFVQPFDRPGRPQQVSTSGGIGPVWRDDGRELYFEARGQFMVVTMSDVGNTLNMGTPQRLFDIHTPWFAPNQPHNVEVAANGQKFLVNTIVGNSDNAPLEVTVNWVNELTRRVPIK